MLAQDNTCGKIGIILTPESKSSEQNRFSSRNPVINSPFPHSIMFYFTWTALLSTVPQHRNARRSSYCPIQHVARECFYQSSPPTMPKIALKICLSWIQRGSRYSARNTSSWPKSTAQGVLSPSDDPCQNRSSSCPGGIFERSGKANAITVRAFCSQR